MNKTANTGVIQEAGDEVDLTPMLDVVFIMLIFFIVTASFIRETGIVVNRPEASQITVDESAAIIIVIEENDDIRIERRLIDPRAVRANIEKMYADIPQAMVVIQADKRSTNDTLVQVINASREAGVYDIAIAIAERGTAD